MPPPAALPRVANADDFADGAVAASSAATAKAAATAEGAANAAGFRQRCEGQEGGRRLHPSTTTGIMATSATPIHKARPIS